MFRPQMRNHMQRKRSASPAFPKAFPHLFKTAGRKKAAVVIVSSGTAMQRA
jgi:hypothetical protein